MNYHLDSNEQARLAEARESFSGRLLTNAQFDEAIAVTGIIEREIRKSGSFKDKLGDYSFAMARSEKMDAVKAETVIRDLFKARTGQTMNQMREALAEREKSLAPEAKDKAYQYAADIGDMVREGDKMSFYRAYAHQAEMLGREFGISDAAAKNLMAETFRESEGRDLFEWGKELDEQYYRPQIEADKQARARTQDADGGQDRLARQGGGSSGSYHQQPRRAQRRPSP